MKKIRYALEALLLHLLFFVFRILPLDTASDISGWLGKTIGPLLATSRKARRNLNMALPNLDEQQQKKIIAEMWDNLGRIIAEYPHLKRIGIERTLIRNREIAAEILDNDKPAIFFGAHMGNWEVNSIATLMQFGKTIDITYRAPNNPWSDKLLMNARSMGGRIRGYPKSRGSGRQIVGSLRNNRSLGILIDQKYNEGIAVDFFGIKAMTNPVFVQLCQKYDYPLIPIQNKRLKGANFELIVYEPLTLFSATGEPLPVQDVIAAAHALIEKWIREEPGQWLWLHRRWDSKDLKD